MRSSLALALALAFGAFAAGQTPAKSAEELAKLGPAVGQRVPDFSLVDQNGATRTLESILGPAGAMLVFFRSAEW